MDFPKEGGKPVIHVSGFVPDGASSPDIAVSGEDLFPSATGEVHIQHFTTNNTIYIGIANSPTSIKTTSTANISDYGDVLRRIDQTQLEDKEEIKRSMNSKKKSKLTVLTRIGLVSAQYAKS